MFIERERPKSEVKKLLILSKRNNYEVNTKKIERKLQKSLSGLVSGQQIICKTLKIILCEKIVQNYRSGQHA